MMTITVSLSTSEDEGQIDDGKKAENRPIFVGGYMSNYS